MTIVRKVFSPREFANPRLASDCYLRDEMPQNAVSVREAGVFKRIVGDGTHVVEWMVPSTGPTEASIQDRSDIALRESDFRR